MSQDEIQVKPQPRILAVLGDIELKPWQCLAELVDNAFDDFINADLQVSHGYQPTVSISLPSKDSKPRTSEVWVRDNGRGMSLAQLNNAIRAGWTNNDRYGALGLYGMGFNIATARLGRKTTIKTTRVGDPSWVVVELDLVRLSQGDDYGVPVHHEPKSNPDEHGTHVIISDLKQDQWDKLVRQSHAIRKQLGDVYSYLLREKTFLITVNGKKFQPLRPCVWDSSRSVTRHGSSIPAVIDVDVKLPPAKACLDCGHWNMEWSESCTECGRQRLEIRERRIWGWIGIQRYLHDKDYGIDFLRNGRKILVRDKRLFSWEDPDGIDEPYLEYPVDSRRARGRIVGEIHCDHVPVIYTKDGFEYNTREWRTVVSSIRGEGPLREKKATEKGYPLNTSILGRLYAGYRREDAGLNYLVPGDGKDALFEKAIEWAKKFRDNDPEYQTDEVWYQAAYQHDHPFEDESDESSHDTLGQMGLGDDEDTGTPVAPSDPRNANSSTTSESQSSTEPTLDERLAEYRRNARPLTDLRGDYEAPGLGRVELHAWVVNQESLTDSSGEIVPSFAQMVKAPMVEVFLASKNPIFTDFGFDIRDLAMIEVAEFMRIRVPVSSGDMRPLSSVLADIKSRATGQKVTYDALVSRAGHLLDRVREAMHHEVKGAPTGYWELLPESDRALTQRQFVAEGGDIDWDTVISSGAFTQYLPANAIVRLLEGRPEMFFDGKIFKRPYASLIDDESRALAVSRTVGVVSDLAVMEEHQPKLGLVERQRVSLSCLIVENDLTDVE